MTFAHQEQLALPEPPSSAHQRALSNGNAHPEVPATAAAAVAAPSLLEEPVTAPAPAPAQATAPAPTPTPAPTPSAADLLGDLLAPLAIEAAPGTMPSDKNAALDLGLDPSGLAPGPAPVQASGPADPLALALYDGPDTNVQVRDYMDCSCLYMCCCRCNLPISYGIL